MLRRDPIQRQRQRQAQHRSVERGAVMVEALIVISFMVIGFQGLMYFYNFYLQQIHSMRLAQSSVIAYSLGGCSENQPREWMRSDLGNLALQDPEHSDEPAVPSDSGGPATSQNEGVSNALGDMDGLLPGGSGVLNPMTAARSWGRVTLTTSEPGPLRRTSKLFEGTVGSTSYVTCGELPREGSVKQMLSDMWSTFKGPLGL